MNKAFQIGTAISLCFSILISCKKSVDDNSAPPVDESTTTPIGSPTGALIKKTIDQVGGTIQSADGRLLITIPSGALEAATEISVQPINNELPGGVGNAYRLLPHGSLFKKPVSITFRYEEEDLASTIAECLDIAFQNSEGSWESPMNSILNKTARTLTVTSTHFSDWGFFKSLNLTPEEATVELGGAVELKVTTRFPYIDPDDAAPGTQALKILRTPRELKPHELKKWTYAGDGILVSRGSQAFYTAPEEEPEANPEAVVAEIHMARKGQFMLVSNITVLAGHNVRYLKVDEDFKSPVNNGNCMLYMYGNFGNDPGTGKRSITINGTTVETDLWSPTVIRCKIDREIAGAIEIKANNKTIARSVLRKYTGSFLYERFHGGKINAASTKALKEATEFKIVYRGFGAPRPADIDPIFTIDGLAAFGTRADYSLSGEAAVTTPGTCPVTTSVSLSATNGIFLHNAIHGSTHNRFIVETTDIEGGIEINIDFSVLEVMTGVRVKRQNCNYSSFDTPKSLSVGLEGFRLKPIDLAFSGEKLVLKGESTLKSAPLSSSILIEAWDGTGNPSHYKTDGLVPAVFKNK